MDKDDNQSGDDSFDDRLTGLNMEALAEFAAGAGHEINNPLAIISGYAQLMLGETSDSNHRRYLSLIIAQTRRAYEMIADIRLFARPPEPEYERVVLKSLLDECVGKLNDQSEGRVSFSLAPCPETMEVMCDGGQLQTILLALGRNTIEAAIQPGRAVFSFTLSGDKYELELEDDGPGIPDTIREKIFFPYYSGRQAGRGLGFGLSKAWRLLQGMHGTIRLVDGSRFERGCCWKIVLPVGSLCEEEEESDSDEKEN